MNPLLWLWGYKRREQHSRAREPFCEIDADKLEAARNDPRVQAFQKAADAHIKRLRAEGRIHE